MGARTSAFLFGSFVHDSVYAFSLLAKSSQRHQNWGHDSRTGRRQTHNPCSQSTVNQNMKHDPAPNRSRRARPGPRPRPRAEAHARPRHAHAPPLRKASSHRAHRPTPTRRPSPGASGATTPTPASHPGRHEPVSPYHVLIELRLHGNWYAHVAVTTTADVACRIAREAYRAVGPTPVVVMDAKRWICAIWSPYHSGPIEHPVDYALRNNPPS